MRYHYMTHDDTPDVIWCYDTVEIVFKFVGEHKWYTYSIFTKFPSVLLLKTNTLNNPIEVLYG